MESTWSNDLLSIFMNCSSFYESGKNSMRSRTNQIHTCRCHMSVMWAVLDYFLNLSIVRDMPLSAIFEEGLPFVFTNLQLGLATLVK